MMIGYDDLDLLNHDKENVKIWGVTEWQTDCDFQDLIDLLAHTVISYLWEWEKWRINPFKPNIPRRVSQRRDAS